MKYKRINPVSLSDHVVSIIFGSLLGDGSLKIHKGYTNARFSFRHSIVQKNYFLWKANQLKEISAAKYVFQQKADGFSKNEKMRYQSCALPELTELYQITHKQHKFVVKRRWLNIMTPLSLAVWWCDDGSIVGNARKGVLCTDGFDELFVKRLAKYLEVNWNLKTHVGAVSRSRESKKEKYYRLWFSTEELKKFLRIILPYVPVEEMLQKTLILYNDPQLQERWISEVIKLSKFSN